MSRVIFQFYDLAASLRPHVLGLFHIAVPKGELVEPQLVLPDGGCCLYLNLGQPLTVIDMDGVTHFRRYPQAVLARGVLSRPHFLDCSLGVDVWGIKFRPDLWSDWRAMNGADQEYFTHARLAEIFGPLWELCRQDGGTERSLPAILSFLEGIVPRLFPAVNPAFLTILEEIRYSMGAVKLEETLDDSGVQYKFVERSFNQYIGVSPKDYAKILRISSSVCEMLNHMEIPYFHLKELGFFDISHFFKEFKRYFGTTPKKIMTDLRPQSLMLTRKVTRQEMALMR